MFVDRVKLNLIAGKGGNGVVAWHRAKYLPKGGPTGGNGGPGGDIVIQTDPNIFTLDEYKHRKVILADAGCSGGGNSRQGKTGQNFILRVPMGTIVRVLREGEEGQELSQTFDLQEDDEKMTLVKGGRGGRGNKTFATAKNRAPAYATPGREGESCFVELELKLIADVGLVGFPNAGKSTLISKLSRSKARIGDYPFTTLHPNLGIIDYEDFTRVCIADIPGIIEGASDNRGLGLEILRHVERTKLLVFFVDLSKEDPCMDYRILQEELAKYDSKYGVNLLSKEQIVLLNKMDHEEAEKGLNDFAASYPDVCEKAFKISALRGDGLSDLKLLLKKLCVENYETCSKQAVLTDLPAYAS